MPNYQPDEAELKKQRIKHEAWLSQQPGFGGDGIGIGSDGRHCITIYTKKMPEETKRNIRSVMADLPIEFQEIGEVRAF